MLIGNVVFSRNYVAVMLKCLNCESLTPSTFCRRYSSNGSVTSNSDEGPLSVKEFSDLPGPPRIPFLGVINDIINLGKAAKLHETISKHHNKYGDIFRIQIGKADAIFLKSPDLMRSVFKFEGKYPKHPLPESWVYYNKKHGLKRGIFFMNDEEWLKYRKILNGPLLRDFGWTRKHIEKRCDKVICDLKRDFRPLDNSFHALENLEGILYRWSIEVTLNLMLGSAFSSFLKLPEVEGLLDEFTKTVFKIFVHSSQLMSIPPELADILKIEAWVDFENVVPETIDMAVKIIDLSMDKVERGDGLLDKLQQMKVDREYITKIFADLIIAAGDTTSFTTLWCFYLIAKNKEIQQQVRKKLKEKSDDLETPLIRGVLRETLRLYPVAPFIGRFLAEDAVIGGYKIPKNVLALLSLYSAGRDPNNFSNPNEFIPSRWLRCEDHSNQIIKPHASMPFAIGSRSCIGRQAARMEVHFLLSKMLRSFEIRVANVKDVPMELKMISVPSEKIKFEIKKLY